MARVSRARSAGLWCFMAVWISLTPSVSHGDDLVASLAQLPIHSQMGADGAPEGGFVEIVKAIDQVYDDGDISIRLFPFARSLFNVQSGAADFHIPLIRTPHVDVRELPFSYVSKRITEVIFVLYSRADRPPLAPSDLDGLAIETQNGHKGLFGFAIDEVHSIAAGMAKLLAGRSDGFIMEQEAVDDYIRRHQITNIRRALYAKWDSCIVIPKGPRQAQLDQTLSRALEKLEASGALARINQSIHQPYQDWQPFKTPISQFVE